MKYFRVAAAVVAALMFCFGVTASPARAPAEQAVGVHGMVLFGGEDGLFASHLPMFHAPHDAQVVLRIRFADAALERALREELRARPRLWTLSPERFDLLRLQGGAREPLQRLTADVFEGHFERDGTPRHRAATVVVEQVVMFRRLAPAGRPAAWHYRRIAASTGAREQFLVLSIDTRPGADHIVALQPSGVSLPETVTIPARTGALHAAREDIDRALERSGVAVRAEIHRETQDLR